VDDRLKRRLVGAVVLIALGVIFIPMILDGSGRSSRLSMDVEIPPAPVYEVPDRLPPLPTAAPDPAPPAVPRAESKPEATLKSIPDEPQPKSSTPPSPTPPAPAPTPPVSDTAPAEDAPPSAWVVQVGSFEDQAKAVTLRDKLRKGGFTAFVEPHRAAGGKTLYRVRIGPELKRESSEEVLARLKREQKLDGIVVSHP
jgi:DedD protein